jgi:hypothetical protein
MRQPKDLFCIFCRGFYNENAHRKDNPEDGFTAARKEEAKNRR